MLPHVPWEVQYKNKAFELQILYFPTSPWLDAGFVQTASLPIQTSACDVGAANMCL